MLRQHDHSARFQKDCANFPVDFLESMTTNTGSGQSDPRDLYDDFITDAKLDHVVGSDAQIWSGQSHVSKHVMRLGNGIGGERGI